MDRRTFLRTIGRTGMTLTALPAIWAPDAAAHRTIPLGMSRLRLLPPPAVPVPLGYGIADNIGVADGVTVSSWPDEVGVIDFAQATSGKRPTYEADVANGKGGVLFSGSTILKTATIAALTEPSTVVLIVKTPDTAPGATQFVLDSPGASRRAIFHTSGRLFGGQATAAGLASGRVPGGTVTMLGAVFDGTGSVMANNGVETTGDTGAATAPTALSLGARYVDDSAGWTGHILAWLLWDRDVSRQFSQIAGWAAREYGIERARTGVYYVDTAGNAANTGRHTYDPLTTLSAALTSAIADDTDATIKVTAPQATPLREQAIATNTRAVAIRPTDGATPWFLSGSEPFTSGWTLTGSVYHRAVTGYGTGCNGVFVSTLTDADGNWVRLTENTATPTTPAAGEYGQVIAVDGTGTIYVRLPASASPNGHTIECAKFDYGIWARRAGLVTVTHARFYAQNVAGTRTGGTGVTDDGNTVVEDSEAWYANVGGFATAAGTWTSARYARCDAYASRNDGFNIHGGESGSAPQGEQVATLTDCDAAYNLDEGCSAHERTTVIQTGGRMHHNGSGGITHINHVVTTTTGVEIDHNQRVNLSGDSGGVNFLDSVSGAMTGCTVHDNPHEGIKRYSTATIAVSGNTSGTANGNGLADNLAAT